MMLAVCVREGVMLRLGVRVMVMVGVCERLGVDICVGVLVAVWLELWVRVSDAVIVPLRV